VPKVDYLIILSCPLAPKNVKGQRLSRKNGQSKISRSRKCSRSSEVRRKTSQIIAGQMSRNYFQGIVAALSSPVYGTSNC